MGVKGSVEKTEVGSSLGHKYAIRVIARQTQTSQRD